MWGRYLLVFLCLDFNELDMRDSKLREARDQKIFDRYIYWTEVRRVRFDDAIKILSEQEFFLTEYVILSVVRDAIRTGRKSSSGQGATKLRFLGFRIKKKPQKDAPTAKQLFLFEDEKALSL